MLLLTRNRLLHLNSWFYFLILIDELLADAAGDYLLKGGKKVRNKLSKQQISFGCFSRAHTDRNQVMFPCEEESERGQCPGGLLLCGAARKIGMWSPARGRQRL